MATFNVSAHPGSSSPEVSRRMSRARRRDTAAEMALRRELHRRGRRYRVVFRVPGNNRRTIDIAFTRQRVAVFVDGCFWHGCPEHGTRPTANGEWWQQKLQANRARDADTDATLSAHGWISLRLWEHLSPETAADQVEAVLEQCRASVGRRGREA